MSFCHYFSVIETCATRQVREMMMMLKSFFFSRSSAMIGVFVMKIETTLGKEEKINNLWLLIE